jgi:hypothetical protein
MLDDPLLLLIYVASTTAQSVPDASLVIGVATWAVSKNVSWIIICLVEGRW